MPDKLRELQELFLVEAAKYNVFPLDNSILERIITPRPSATAGRNAVHLLRRAVRAPDPATRRASSNRSYTITADVEVPQGGGEGMIVTEGGRFGGYGLYLLKGKPVFIYNLLDLERFRWEGAGGARAGQAHHRVRLQVRRTRLRQGRHRRAEGGRQRKSPTRRSRTRFRSS